MKVNNKKYIVAMDEFENNILDILTYGNGKPRYFSSKDIAESFLKKLYKKNQLKIKPFKDDGVQLLCVH